MAAFLVWGGWFGFGLVVSGLVDFVAVLVGVVVVLWVVVGWLVCFGSGRLFWSVLCGWLICFGLFCVLYGLGLSLFILIVFDNTVNSVVVCHF